MTGILLVLASSAGWVGLDAIRKSIGHRVPAFVAAGAIAGAQFPFLLLGFAIGWGDDWRVLFEPTYLSFAIPTVLLNIIAGYGFVRAVQESPLGLTIPYLSFTPVFSAVIGMFALAQIPTVFGWVGIAMVVIGAVFLNPASDGVFNPIAALRKERGSLYMLGVAALWSITPVLDKRATESTGAFLHTLTLSFGIGLGCYLITIVRDRDLKTFFSKLRPVAGGLLWVAALTNIVALGCQLAAYEYVDVAYVETIKRAIGVVGSLVIGTLFFKERFTWVAYSGAAFMTAGVATVLLLG